MASEIFRQPNSDGTITIFYDDGGSRTVGNARDAGADARRQLEALQAVYGDPWYQENVLGPMNRASEAAAAQQGQEFGLRERTTNAQIENARKQLQAQIENNRATIELRKRELQQQAARDAATLGLNARGQDIDIWSKLASMRGFGNAAQYIDAAYGFPRFQGQTNALAQVAAGGQPTGAFGSRFGMQPVSSQETALGMQGASDSDILARHANDAALATAIYSNPSQIARGAIQRLPKGVQDYLGSYGEEQGFDQSAFEDAYARAGIMQGRRG